MYENRTLSFFYNMNTLDRFVKINPRNKLIKTTYLYFYHLHDDMTVNADIFFQIKYPVTFQ